MKCSSDVPWAQTLIFVSFLFGHVPGKVHQEREIPETVETLAETLLSMEPSAVSALLTACKLSSDMNNDALQLLQTAAQCDTAAVSANLTALANMSSPVSPDAIQLANLLSSVSPDTASQMVAAFSPDVLKLVNLLSSIAPDTISTMLAAFTQLPSSISPEVLQLAELLTKLDVAGVTEALRLKVPVGQDLSACFTGFQLSSCGV